MICDCEVYEICPSCAPSEPTYAKAAAANDEAARRRSESLSPSYTLAELEQLAKHFDKALNLSIVEQLALSTFLAWLASEEKEAKDET